MGRAGDRHPGARWPLPCVAGVPGGSGLLAARVTAVHMSEAETAAYLAAAFMQGEIFSQFRLYSSEASLQVNKDF